MSDRVIVGGGGGGGAGTDIVGALYYGGDGGGRFPSNGYPLSSIGSGKAGLDIIAGAGGQNLCGSTNGADGGPGFGGAGGQNCAANGGGGGGGYLGGGGGGAVTSPAIPGGFSGGSGTGIAALINGTLDIANASRAMKDKEIEEAKANGVEAVEHVIAIDALAIIVNPANPITQLTIDQLADIFTGRVTNWKDVGGNDAPIVIVSRETNSGTHVYFLEEVGR